MADMGIGKLGGAQLIFKRKFRWTFRIDDICQQTGVQKVDEHFVKLAARPNLTIEETEINFQNAKTWIPGKASWETITVTYYDVATSDNQSLWNYLASVYEFTDPVRLRQGASRNQYGARGTLLMYDGCGNPLEVWTLNDMWPQAMNFGELDYSSSEEATIELTLRYSSVDYKSLCPNFTPQNCCGPCTGTVGREIQNSNF
jgi:hypothetical protein